jgi:hypothetical protein
MEMASHSLEGTVSAANSRSPGICHFLNLFLELRDIIYSMLLTTPYCTTLDRGLRLTCPWDVDEPSHDGRAWRFHIHTAILLVNKQISAEATRMLYQGNDFIILKDTGVNLWVDAIPKFERLTHSRIEPLLEDPGSNSWFNGLPRFERLALSRIDPVLRIEVTKYGVEVSEYTRYLVTTPEGLQSIIRALWIKETDRTHPVEIINHGMLNLTLDFNLKAASQYQVLSELITRPWERVSVNELILRGDIKEPMREHLVKSNLEGPIPNNVAAQFTEYNCLAEQAFGQGNYDAAQWWWGLLEEYWLYVSRVRPYHLDSRRICMENDQLREVLRESYYKCHEGLMKIVKECIRQMNYRDATVFADDALSRRDVDDIWEFDQFGHRLTPIMYMKLQLCACLALTARGKIDDGMESLEAGANSFPWGSRILNRHVYDTNHIKLFEDLKRAIDNELIRACSPWRFGCQFPVISPIGDDTGEWQFGVVQRSFWEWLKLPEERELALLEEQREA